MIKIHLKLEYTNNTLCGKQSLPYLFIDAYLKNPNLDGYWCPDCINHPDLVMARLNRTNV